MKEDPDILLDEQMMLDESQDEPEQRPEFKLRNHDVMMSERPRTTKIINRNSAKQLSSGDKEGEKTKQTPPIDSAHAKKKNQRPLSGGGYTKVFHNQQP